LSNSIGDLPPTLSTQSQARTRGVYSGQSGTGTGILVPSVPVYQWSIICHKKVVKNIPN